MRWQARKRRKYQWLWILTLCIAASSILFINHLLPIIGNYVILDNFTKSAEFGLILAGQVPDRAMEAATLYNEGKIAAIIVSKGREPSGFKKLQAIRGTSGVNIPTEAEVNRTILQAYKVPTSKIISIEQQMSSTSEEARYLQQHFKPKSLVIVTSKTHSRRAYFIFRAVLGGDVDLMVKPSRYDDFNPNQWWRQRQSIKEVIIEYQKLLTRHFTV